MGMSKSEGRSDLHKADLWCGTSISVRLRKDRNKGRANGGRLVYSRCA